MSRTKLPMHYTSEKFHKYLKTGQNYTKTIIFLVADLVRIQFITLKVPKNCSMDNLNNFLVLGQVFALALVCKLHRRL